MTDHTIDQMFSEAALRFVRAMTLSVSVLLLANIQPHAHYQAFTLALAVFLLSLANGGVRLAYIVLTTMVVLAIVPEGLVAVLQHALIK